MTPTNRRAKSSKSLRGRSAFRYKMPGRYRILSRLQGRSRLVCSAWWPLEAGEGGLARVVGGRLEFALANSQKELPILHLLVAILGMSKRI